MTKISDQAVYPRIYINPEDPGMNTVFFAPNSPGFWLNTIDSSPADLSSAQVDCEAEMPKKWPHEVLEEDPKLARATLSALSTCTCDRNISNEVSSLDTNWRRSWRHLS